VLPECGSVFHLNDLHLITEIVNPDTGSPGEEGELVFTTLTREAMPLLRYRSGDRARWAECSCWLPARAVQLLGRVDAKFTAGDMNLHGRVMAEAIGQIPGTTGHVELVLDKSDLADHLIVRVEGNGVDKIQVRWALFDALPNLERSADDGQVVLGVATGVDLGDQIKAVRIKGKRRGGYKAEAGPV
jgi:phenylacetate-CoA ligase